MKIKDCLELGKECGLQTVGECIDNIDIHCTSLFIYPNINKELNELYTELKTLTTDMDIESEDLISTEDALKFIG